MTFQYDANGRMTQRTAGGITLGISWNADNMPTLIKKNNSDYMAFTYDGKGQRVRKQNLWSGQSTLYFGEAYEMRGNVGVIHLFCGPHRVASIRTDGKDQYYHGNHLGSASVITNSSGDRKERVEYFPFGAYRERTDYDASFPNANYTFTDQEDDDELGFYNYKARLYDPALGRFISADTIVQASGDPQSLNRYTYARNNPLMYTDPTGHFWFAFFIGALIGAIFSGIQSHWNLQSMIIGGFIGGISGGLFAEVSGTVGGYISHITLAGAMGPPTPGMMLAGQIGGGIVGGAAAGATAGGLGTAFYGGNVFNGMLTGAGYGALSGGVFGAINGYYGSNWTLGRVGAQTLAGGGIAALTGGDFERGALLSFGAASAAYAYDKMVNYGVTWAKGGEAVPKYADTPPVEGANNVGWATLKPGVRFFDEGGPVSTLANQVPGINAVAGLHDVFQIGLDQWGARDRFCWPGMLPAAAITYSALMTDMGLSVLLNIMPRSK